MEPLPRSEYLGGRDIAAILGKDPRRTPLDVYHEKVGVVAAREETRAMRLGKKFEPIILEEYALATGFIVQPAVFLVHPKFPFLAGSLDGIARRGDEARVVEAKATELGTDWGEDGTDEVPYDHLAQGQFYALLAALNGIAVAACDYPRLLRYWGFATFTAPFARADAEKLVQLAVWFWTNHVLLRVPPDPVTLEEAKKAYAPRYGAVVQATAADLELIDRRRTLKAEIKTREEALEGVELALLNRLAGAEAFEHDCRVILTCKQQTQDRFDQKAFGEAHPALLAEFRKEVTFPKFHEPKNKRQAK